MKFTRPCKLCGNPTKLFGSEKIKLKSQDGTSTVRICDDCAFTLENIRHLKEGKELKDNDDEAF